MQRSQHELKEPMIVGVKPVLLMVTETTCLTRFVLSMPSMQPRG
ncbi:hypothetical protein SAMN04515620_11636 [Collimonas sp. OK607]|nr:hypothetical protein SAMN04515620_11636 [Collimonas sp. OK607]